MSLYSTFKTDANLEKSGVWLNYGPNAKGDPIRIKIARAGGANKAFGKAVANKSRPHRRKIETNTLDAETSDRLNLEVYAETVILGWENVEDENGKVMEFTKDNVIKLFTDLPDLFADVRLQAQEVAIFRGEEAEAIAKN